MQKHEFIGKKLFVVTSKNKIEVGIDGVVMDETQNTFTIYSKKNIKKIMKNNITFRVDDSEIINGSSINLRPEDRIKKVKKNGKRN